MKCDNIITLAGSKSILNRLLIISTYLDSKLKITNTSHASDIVTMKENISKLGLKISEKDKNLTIIPTGKSTRKNILNINDSGTAYRFLLARMCTKKDKLTKIKPSAQLKKRPIKPLVKILRSMGAKIEVFNSNISIIGTKLQGGTQDIPANLSSQFISALLLIAPDYEHDLILNLQGKIVSKSYIDMTIKIMRDFGITIDFTDDKILIKQGQKYQNPDKYIVEPDYSSACYLWALGAISEKNICIKGRIEDSLQPDSNFLKILMQIGARVEFEKNLSKVSKKFIKGSNFDMIDMPDQVPTLAILALFSDSKMVIENVSHLKYKESNRVKALVANFKNLGVEIYYDKNNLRIHPLKKSPSKVTLFSHQDHRLALSFSLLKYKYSYLKVTDIDAIDKSFPEFRDLITRFGS